MGPGPFEDQGGAHFGKAGVVCVCGAVCVCVACHGVSNALLNDLFLRCVFGWHGVKSHDHCSKKAAFGGNASL